MNWYEVLEVSPSASPQVIRAAYKSLMQRYHPDKGDPSAHAADGERAKLLAQAYAVLSDSTRRHAYDLQLQRLAQPAAPAPRLVPSAPSTARSPRRMPLGFSGAVALCALVLMGGVLFKNAGPSPAQPPSAGTQPSTQAVSAVPFTPPRDARRVHWPPMELAVFAQNPALATQEHALTIPALVWELGPWQAEEAAWRLNQPASVKAVQSALAAMPYETLIATDAQAALTRTLREAANTALGAPTPPPPQPGDTGGTRHYGVVAVQLPQAFFVR